MTQSKTFFISGVSLDKFVEDNVSFAPQLRTIFEEENSPIIETDRMTPEDTAKEIVMLLYL